MPIEQKKGYTFIVTYVGSLYNISFVYRGHAVNTYALTPEEMEHLSGQINECVFKTERE